MPVPDLPEPAHPDIDSMLSRKFGKEVANYFSGLSCPSSSHIYHLQILTHPAGSPLNRFGFLRGDNVFLSSALRHPSTSILPLKDLAPLIKEKTHLEYVKYQDVESLIGDAYKQSESDMIEQYNSTKHTPQMIFLGLDESVKGGFEWESKGAPVTGAPYFALDVTPNGSVKEECEKLLKGLEDKGLSFAPGRAMDLVAGDGMYTIKLSQYPPLY